MSLFIPSSFMSVKYTVWLCLIAGFDFISPTIAQVLEQPDADKITGKWISAKKPDRRGLSPVPGI
jgi:hypothetical protein